MTKMYCNRCRKWVDNLYQVPHRYIASLVGVNDKVFSSNEVQEVVEIWGIEFGVCQYCISELANKRRNYEKATQLMKAGYVFHVSSRKVESGHVYIAYHEKGVYKIGATRGAVSVRMSQQGYYPYHFIHAIKTHHVWGLESFLHHHFRDRRISLREFFELQKQDFRFIGNIKEFNSKPVKHVEAYE